MITAKLKKRGVDDWGSGEFGASRGDRTHNGIDYACEPGTEVCAPVSGVVSKFGYCYRDDLSFRYVQIADSLGWAHRVFYVEPREDLEIGDRVEHGEIIGKSQKLGDRYPGITEHVHYEIKCDGVFIDPEGEA